MHAPLTALFLFLAAAEYAEVPVAAEASTLSLFPTWNVSDWTASDDSVRGGKSQSHLEILSLIDNNDDDDSTGDADDDSSSSIARFYGTLDYEALNGSGFASQRTVNTWPEVDISAYDRIVLEVASASNSSSGSSSSEGKTFTFNLIDEVTPPVNGAEQASVNWGHNFQVPASTAEGEYEQVEVRFKDLVPTYQGRVLNETAPANFTGIKRVNFMIRSFFGQEAQAGDFELRIKSVLAADSALD